MGIWSKRTSLQSFLAGCPALRGRKEGAIVDITKVVAEVISC
jgi:hypothetical protein